MDIRRVIDAIMVTLSVVLYAAIFVTCAAMVFAPPPYAAMMQLASQ